MRMLAVGDLPGKRGVEGECPAQPAKQGLHHKLLSCDARSMPRIGNLFRQNCIMLITLFNSMS